jgi:hypothetical protein
MQAQKVLNIDTDLHQLLKQIAMNRHTTMGKLVQDILVNHLSLNPLDNFEIEYIRAYRQKQLNRE